MNVNVVEDVVVKKRKLCKQKLALLAEQASSYTATPHRF